MKNKLMKKGNCIIRILNEKEDKVLIIDCIKKTMPYWCEASSLLDYDICSEDELGFIARSEELSAAQKRTMHERYTLIAGILPFISDEKSRSMLILSHSRKNRHKKVLKNGMNRRNSFDFSQSVAFIPRFA